MSYLSDYLEQYFDEVNYKDFYRDIFPEGSLQDKGEYETGKYNGIIVEVTNDKLQNGKPKVLRHTLTNDLEKLDEVVGRDNFCLMSPISYAGKTRDSSMARELYALTFDVDGLIEKDNAGIRNMLHQMNKINLLPMPTYIVSSGTGVHVYYVFERPIPLFENVLEQLERYKRRLTWFLWHDSISTLHDDIQYEPVCQGFRIVGTITKKNERVRAFSTGKKVTMEYLNSFFSEEYQVTEFTYKSNLTLEQAKNKYPEWYQDRIVNKKPKNTWQFSRRVYDKWLERIKTEYSIGHRYWCMWVLTVTAMKCGISQEELEDDAFGLLDVFNQRAGAKEKPFTKEDILAALEGYDSAWITYPIEKMAYRSDISIQKNKRNYQKQKDHLEEARAIRDIRMHRQGRKWDDNNGRKPKKNIVQEWRKQHPEGRKVDCIRDTGLDKKTVYKWWDGGSKVTVSSASIKKIKLSDEQLIQMFITDMMKGLSVDEITEKVINAVDPNSSDEERIRVRDLIASTQQSMKNILDLTKK